jgi:TonB family protein
VDVIPSESACPEGGILRGLAVGTMKIPRLRRFAAPLGMTTCLACVHTVTHYYLPDARNPRFDADAATQVLEQYVRLRCPDRLAAKKSESGDVRLTITADTSGAVTRAELVSSSGDDMLDGLFGTVAAQLKVDSLRATTKAMATRRVRIGFSCAPSATVATLEMLRR